MAESAIGYDIEKLQRAIDRVQEYINGRKQRYDNPVQVDDARLLFRVADSLARSNHFSMSEDLLRNAEKQIRLEHRGEPVPTRLMLMAAIAHGLLAVSEVQPEVSEKYLTVDEDLDYRAKPKLRVEDVVKDL